jgi:hypothetical protein
MLGNTTISRAQSLPSDRQVGDIFVAIGGGTYQVWHLNSETGEYELAESIVDGVGSGGTAGCAFDSTYHPFTTNVTNAKVFRDMIDDPQTPIQTISVTPANGAQPTSIALDSLGNSYVGVAGGNGLIEEYAPNGSLVQTLPVNTRKLKGGSAWMDLSTDAQTIYFTNLSNTISQLKVSSSGTSSFASISGASLYGLRVLTPAAQNATSGLPGGPGVLLVVAVFNGSSNIELLNSSGTTIKTYSVTTPFNETNFQVLTLDPNGTSFWAGNPTTNNFYRFNLATGRIEVNAVNTGVGSGPNGLCAYGGFSGAQLPSITLAQNQVVTQPITVAASLTPGTSTANTKCTAVNAGSNSFDCTFSTPVPDLTSGPNSLTLTVNGINLTNAPNGLQLTYNYSQIAQGAGSSDTGLACDLTSPDGTACEVHSADLAPIKAPPNQAGLYGAFDLELFSTQGVAQGIVNPRLLRDEATDVTDFVIHDVRLGGSGGNSVFTMNEQPIQTTGSQSCGYTSPLINSQYRLGRTIPVKFQAIGASGNCSSGPFLANLHPRLVLLQNTGLSTSDAVPQPVPYTLADGTPCPVAGCYYALDHTTNTWILNVKTSTLTGGGTQYFGTTIDDSNQIPLFSNTTSGLNVTDFFTLN